MSTTSFDGPVKAGDILNTIGTTLSDDVANVGFATMGQVAVLDENSDDPSWTDIVIPANSQITRIACLVTAAWDGLGQVDIGRSDSVADDDEYFVKDFVLTAIGLKEVTTEAMNLASWKDTGATDIHITHTSAGELGKGVLIVEYIQNNNLTVD